MLNGLSLSIHFVDINTRDSGVVGVIIEQIDKVHVREHVVTGGDNPVDDNVSTLLMLRTAALSRASTRTMSVFALADSAWAAGRDASPVAPIARTTAGR